MKTPIEHYGQPRRHDDQGGSHIAKINGNWVCLCGNIAEHDGFHACTRMGVDCEPEPGWEGFYKCGACGLIIEGDTAVIHFPPLPHVPSNCERLRDAIKALDCEYDCSVEMPEHVSVYPKAGTHGADSVDALRWAWGFEAGKLLGNDCHVQRGTETILSGGEDYPWLAKQVLNFMRLHALRRCSYLNDLCERFATRR